MFQNNLTAPTVELKIGGRLWEYSTDYRLFVEYSILATSNGDIVPFLQRNNLPLETETIQAINAIYFEKPKENKGKSSKNSHYLFKYDVLWDLIYSAFYQCYSIDLCEVTLHYAKFQVLLNGITGTKLNDVLCEWGKNIGKLKGDAKKHCAEVRKQYPLGKTTSRSLEARNKRMKDYIKRRRKEIEEDCLS